MHGKTNHVRAKADGLNALAMSFVLPHEYKAMRLPVVPAALTATLETMSDDTYPIPDGTSRRGALCRDPCYPLWLEQTFANVGVGINSYGSATTWNIPARSNSTIAYPNWDAIIGVVGVGTPTVNGRVVTAGQMADYMPIGNAPGTQAFYIPPYSVFTAVITTGAAGGGSGIEIELVSQVGGEEFTATVLMAPTATGFAYSSIAGQLVAASQGEGIVPFGFTYVKQVRTTGTAPTAAATPTLTIGWASGGYPIPASPTGTLTLFAPQFFPPEFANSTIPYGRTRLNSSAALFTNVTAALSKEGTILAARLKPSLVDMWTFTTTHVNSVHPRLRYFGPMEKGLYTFTTPSGNLSAFTDGWTTMTSNSPVVTTTRPIFDYKDYGLYNAFIFNDLGSAAVGTQLAVSCYAHIEFETTSSLFQTGVSTMTLESLHAAEVALLSFGHFHENPLHWAAIRAAATAALKIVAPMVAPYIKRAGERLVDKGVAYLTGRKAAGDRKMTQEQAPKVAKPRPKPRAKKVIVKRA